MRVVITILDPVGDFCNPYCTGLDGAKPNHIWCKLFHDSPRLNMKEAAIQFVRLQQCKDAEVI